MDQEEQNVQETSQEQVSEQQEKLFTQSEVDRIVTDRVKRSEEKLRSKLFEEAKSKVKAEQDEAKKLEEMNASQRRKYEDQKRDEELEQLRAKVQRQEMEQTAMGILKEKGVSVDQDVLDLVVADTAEVTADRIEKLATLIDTRAREIRRRDFNTSAPRQSGSGQKVATLDEFKRMSYTERLELKNDQPELYQDLVKKLF
ncbi:DUF4355 domain-containing protein [Ligilactobacillus faecis]|uniref:DUF4355 domain-containing protein n=1 Tax=Ligilactobacillus faecis TaxID=762833 RepID=A0ABV4DPY7_9LACO